MKKIINAAVSVVISLLVLAIYTSCKKVKIVESTTTDVNIYDYLKRNPAQFSNIVSIIDKSGYAGFLNAYGSYTFFAPENGAVDRHLTEINKKMDQLTEAEAKDIVKFHLMEDTISTGAFKDGKLPLVTLYGQYLITSVTNTGGTSVFTVNRQAQVKQGNIKTGNGYIHEVDRVLKPATKSAAEIIAENPEFSIFKEALIATGYYDTLNIVNTTNPARRWFTVLAQTNKAFQDSGFSNFAALRARYSNTNNPKDPLDSLHIFVAYHIIPDIRYLADIVSANSHSSLQPLEVLLSKLDGEKVLINDVTFNNIHEQGIELQRSASDFSSTTGVVHTALSHFTAKIRDPYPVYWDVADFTEVRKLPSVFRKASFNFNFESIADIRWDKTDVANALKYTWDGLTNTSFPMNYGDHLILRLGATGLRNFWYEFRTPLLVKGKYKVWICYRQQKGSSGSNMPTQISFDGIPTSRTMNFCDTRPNLSDGEMEALGWKRYTPATATTVCGKFVGIVDVNTTDRHMIRFQGLPAAGTGQDVNNLDMIHFIPVNMHQFLPRFSPDGTLVYQ